MLSCVPLLCPAIIGTSRPVENRDVRMRPTSRVSAYDVTLAGAHRSGGGRLYACNVYYRLIHIEVGVENDLIPLSDMLDTW